LSLGAQEVEKEFYISVKEKLTLEMSSWVHIDQSGVK